jgi:hypothetical protein
MASHCIDSSGPSSRLPTVQRSLAAIAFIVSPPPHSQPPASDLARRHAAGTGGLSRLRGDARAMSTAMDENQADGHALLR